MATKKPKRRDVRPRRIDRNEARVITRLRSVATEMSGGTLDESVF